MASNSLRLGIRTINKDPFFLRLLSSNYRPGLSSARTFSAIQQEDKTSESASPDATDSQGTDLNAQIDGLKTQLAEKEKLLADFKDKYIRALAENENVRTRNKKMLDDARMYGIQSFSKDLLEVADILEKATESIPEEDLKRNSHLKDLHEGVVMTETQLQKVFNKHGLEKLDPVGEKFDPNFHDALFMQPFPGKEPGTVAVVTKIGYKLHNRPLRPALVGVVKGD